MKDKFYLFFFSLPILIAFIIAVTSQLKAEMTVDKLKNMMKKDSSLFILDCRLPEELIGSLGKIDNAVSIPLHDFETQLNELEKFRDNNVAVICRNGVRPEKAADILNKNSYKVKNILGGMEAYNLYEELNEK